jgi:hypothetical protein
LASPYWLKIASLMGGGIERRLEFASCRQAAGHASGGLLMAMAG